MQRNSLDFVSCASLPDTELASGNLMSNVAAFDDKTPQSIQNSLLSLQHGLHSEFPDNTHS